MQHRKTLRGTPIALALALVFANPPTSAGRRGTFVLLNGTDTVSIERFTRGSDRLTGEIETRVAGRTSRVTYSLLRNPSGRPVRLEYSLTVPQMGLSTAALDITADSAIGPVMLSERESTFRGVFPAGAIPLLYPLSLAMLEDVVRDLKADGNVPVFVWGNQRPMGMATRQGKNIDPTTVEIAELSGLRLTLNRAGEIIEGHSLTGTTRIVSGPPQMPVVRMARSAAAPGHTPTPPMGWNSWNKFGCRIDEALLRGTADALASSGMLAAGYRYLNIDDCWEARTRNADGDLAVDSVRFPSGMKSLVDYIHSKGLKVGIYSSGGTGTCQGRPATLDHEVQDAKLFANWEMDYVKYDNCNARNRPEQIRFKTMIDAVKATGREMVFSICEWGEARPWLWGRQLGGQLWRTTEDIRDSWLSMVGILDQQVGLEAYAGPDGWNDPDMLEVGNGKMTHNEYVAHFSLWAILNAPLIAGNDVRAMSDSTQAILMNKEVIAVDQDWGGRQGFRLRDDGAHEVWAKPMSDGGWAVVLFNRSTVDGTIPLQLSELGISDSWFLRLIGIGSKLKSRNLWTGETVEIKSGLSMMVPAHGAVMLRLQ